MIKIVFFGTPEYVVPIVDTLNKTFRNAREKSLMAVVTQTPKPAGRGNKLEYSAVDEWAHKNNVEIIFDMDDVPYADLGIVASYGRIIPEFVIDKFEFGLLNIHPSLLPKFRGASPVQSTIVSGDSQTGLTIIKMDKQLDHGPIVSYFKDSVNENETADELRDRLFLRSAEFITELIPNYVSGKMNPKDQDHSVATFTTQIKKEDAYIDPLHLNKVINNILVEDKKEIQFIKEFELDINSTNLHNFIRAMQSWPGAWTKIKIDKNSDSKRLKLIKSHIENKSLILDEVQLEGKSIVNWKQFVEGYPNYVLEE